MNPTNGSHPKIISHAWWRGFLWVLRFKVSLQSRFQVSLLYIVKATSKINQPTNQTKKQTKKQKPKNYHDYSHKPLKPQCSFHLAFRKVLHPLHIFRVLPVCASLSSIFTVLIPIHFFDSESIDCHIAGIRDGRWNFCCCCFVLWLSHVSLRIPLDLRGLLFVTWVIGSAGFAAFEHMPQHLWMLSILYKHCLQIFSFA